VAKLSSTARIGRVIDAAFITESIPGVARWNASRAGTSLDLNADATPTSANETIRARRAFENSPRLFNTDGPRLP
jgi:hypothetical protein